jgi:hypothetical protein
VSDDLHALAEAIRENTGELRALRAEMHASRAKQVQTKRVKAMRAAAKTVEMPVSDLAAMAARRALARVRG